MKLLKITEFSYDENKEELLGILENGLNDHSMIVHETALIVAS